MTRTLDDYLVRKYASDGLFRDGDLEPDGHVVLVAWGESTPDGEAIIGHEVHFQDTIGMDGVE